MSDTHLTDDDDQGAPAPADDPNAPPADEPVEGDEGEGGEPDPDREAQETLARARGWTPPAQWKGKRPDSIIDDPAEYNRMHERSNRRLRDDNARLHAEMEKNSKLAEKTYEILCASKDADIRRLNEALEAKKRTAVEDADTRAYDEALREQRALEATQGGAPATAAPATPAAPPQQPYNPDDDQNFRAWHEDNPWYGTDKGRTNYAETAAVRDVQARGLMPQQGRAYYDAIKAEVDMAFPAMARRSAPNNAGGAAGSGRSKGAKSFDSLPASYKQTFKDVHVKKYGIYKDDEKGRAKYAAAVYRDQDKVKG